MSITDPHIIFLASFPKSGNTWMRSFLAALLKEGKELESFDDLKSDWGILSSRGLIDRLLGIDTGDESQINVQKLRYEAYAFGATELEEDQFVKTHDTPFYKGIPIIPKEIVKQVVLIVRNPFDMVASFANHMSCSLEKAVFALNSGSTALAKSANKQGGQVAQYMGSWSDFYNCWKNTFRSKITIIRYEDMLNDSLITFKKVVESTGLKYSDEDIQSAIEATRFDKLQKLEKEQGFKEKSVKTEQFFRQGKAGNWRNEITQEMAEQIIDRHYSTLLELNYIDEAGEILV